MSKKLDAFRRQLDGATEDQGVIVRKNKYRDQHKEERDPIKLAKIMAKVRAKKDKLEEELKELNAEYDVIRIELIPDVFDELGIENQKIKGLGRVSLTGDLFTRTLNNEGLMEWLHDNGLGPLIKEAVAPSTLKSAIKDRIKDGKELPPGDVVRVTPYTRASITKA